MRFLTVGLLLVTAFIFTHTTCIAQSSTKGFASTYPIALEGATTASGEKYISTEFTACHKNLPFNTLVKVTNLKNNKSVIVRVNDRFSYTNHRVIDISNAAADEINLFGEINPQVSIEVIGMADALMLASVKKKQEELPAKTASAAAASTVAVETPKKAPVTKAQISVAKAAPATSPAKIENPGAISGVGINIPSITLEDINNLASVSIKYIAISLFR